MFSKPFRGRIVFRDIANVAVGEAVRNRCNGAEVPRAFEENAKRVEFEEWEHPRIIKRVLREFKRGLGGGARGRKNTL